MLACSVNELARGGAESDGDGLADAKAAVDLQEQAPASSAVAPNSAPADAKLEV